MAIILADQAEEARPQDVIVSQRGTMSSIRFSEA